ncbi:MAG: hypothetical protein HY547_06690 [Elusimicrobia bacterium]|nr:hypothetical protein [Elusimicrobiota bacterium]
MTRIAIAVAALLAIAHLNAQEHPKEHPTGAAPSAAEEHPKEHPTKSSASGKEEHPKGKEHPEHPKGKSSQAPEGSKAWMTQIRKEYDNAVCEVSKAKTNEPYIIHDDKLGKDWEIKLVRVHKKRIVSLGNNRFFACSDFKSVKKGEKDKLDLDFFATKNQDGTWNVEKVLIHKVNGIPRYTWNEKNEMAPANN